MQYQVVGWTEYDCPDTQDAPLTNAAARAIIEDIRAHGYFFSGFDHQERLLGAPVLNDGYRRAVSRRMFAALMAQAYGEEGAFAYAKYMTDIPSECRKMPTDRYGALTKFDPPVRDVFPYSDLVFPTDMRLRLLYSTRYQYLERGDILRMEVGGESRDYTISGVHILEDKGEIYALKLELSL